MLRVLAAAAVLALALPAGAGPLSRWTSQPLDAVDRLIAGGPGSSTLVVLRTDMDPLRSFDGGKTWTSFVVRGERPVDVSIAPGDGRLWYATSKGVIYRTRNGGDTWEERSRGFDPPQGAPKIGANPDVLYLLVYTPPYCGFPECTGPGSHLATSTDGGLTWRESEPRIFTFRVAASPVDPRLAYTIGSTRDDGVSLRRTLDGGATWQVVPVPERTYFDWILNDIAVDQRDGAVAYVRATRNVEETAGRILVTRDRGTSWTPVSQVDGSLVADPMSANRVYVFARDGRAFESRDAGRSWVRVESGVAGIFPTFAFAPQPVAVVVSDGRRVAMNAFAAKLNRLDLTDGAVALGSDLWWNPAESGAGLTITQHASNRPFVVWYTYDSSGAPVWRVMPGGSWSDRTLTGPLFETRGPSYFGAPFDPARVTSQSIGSATLHFDDESNALFSYSLASGAHGEKRITRQLFAAPVANIYPVVEDLADLYWNPAESGWGMVINHQYNRVFATWYVYGNDGKPLWVVMPDAVLGPEFAGATVRAGATGDLFTTRGPAEGAPFDPAQVVATKVGTATLHLGGSGITLEYTAFGRSETRTLTRQPF